MREIINKVTYLPKKKNKHSMYRSSVKRAENRMCWWLRDKGQLQGLCSHRTTMRHNRCPLSHYPQSQTRFPLFTVAAKEP